MLQKIKILPESFRFGILGHGDEIVRINNVTGETWLLRGASWVKIQEPEEERKNK